MCKLNFVFTRTKKLFTYAFIFPIVFVMVLGVGGLGFPNTAEANCHQGGPSGPIINLTREECNEPNLGGSLANHWDNTNTETLGDAAGAATSGIISTVLPSIESGLAFVVTYILKFVGLLMGLSGIILNGVVYYTIVQMAANYDNISAIKEGWGVIRDLANMGFIFILLYAAIMTILGLGKDNQKLIVKVVVIAILVNFSLFLTSLIIDASNILALFFYDAIAPGATSGNFDWRLTGLSNTFMQHLNLTSLYNVTEGGISTDQIITVGIMGSIFILIAAFVFFAVALMLIIRYVVLIMILILSPIAFMAMVLPQLNKHANRWWEALSGQAFFAPIYFVLTYVTLRVLAGVTGTLQNSFGGVGTAATSTLGSLSQIGALGAGAPNNTLAMIINFIVIIAFLITSLVIAKEWANKAGGGMGKLTSWASGAAGGATLGAAGWANRQTVGRAGQAVAESETLKRMRENSGLVGRTFARTTQAGAKKVGSSSLDLRAGGLGGTLDAGKAGGKGGYEAWRKEADKKEEEYAKSQGPSAKAKTKAKKSREEAENDIRGYEREYREAVTNYGVGSNAAQVAKRYLDEARGRKTAADSLLGNKEEVEKSVKRDEEEKKKEVEKIKNSESLKSAELAERSAQDTVKRLEAEAKAAIGTADEDRRKMEVEAAKENLKEAQKAAKEMRELSRKEIEAVSGIYDQSITETKASEIKSAADRRRDAEVDRVESSVWAKYIGGYNYTAAAKIRDSKKSNKDKLAEAASAFIKEQDGSSGGAQQTPEPPPAPPAGGGGNPTP